MGLMRVCHPRPLQPVPRALGGGRPLCYDVPHGHTRTQICGRGDVGRKGRSSLTPGPQVPIPSRRWGPAPGDTEGQRGLALSMSVVIHFRVLCLEGLVITPALPRKGHGPSKTALGTRQSPCLLSAYAAQRERRRNETVGRKLEVLLGNELWEPQEPLGQMDASLFLPHVLREGGNPLSPPPLPSVPIAASRVLPLCLQQHRLPVHPSRPIRRNREEKRIHFL